MDRPARSIGVRRRIDQEVFAKGTADATVGEFDELLVGSAERALALDNRRIDVDLAHVVDDDCDFETLSVGKHVFQHRDRCQAQEWQCIGWVESDRRPVAPVVTTGLSRNLGS